MCALALGMIVGLLAVSPASPDHAPTAASTTVPSESASYVPPEPTAQQQKVAEAVYAFLTSRGVTPAGAAGVLGNFEAESDLDPAAEEASGPAEGRGLAQWSFTRRDALMAEAGRLAEDWRNLDVQLQFLWKELREDYPRTLTMLRNVTDPVDAAALFHDQYEKSADSDERIVERRGGAALRWFQRLAPAENPSGNPSGTASSGPSSA